MEWVASTLHTTSEHGVSSTTTADALYLFILFYLIIKLLIKSKSRNACYNSVRNICLPVCYPKI